MKIEINENKVETPSFPAFYKDKDGDLWFWVNDYEAVCFETNSIHFSDSYESVHFNDYNVIHEFVKVYGTITITV